jgi:hypothetical protein
MGDTPPEFTSGNRWFIHALNRVVTYAKGHGVNPAGVAGWSWSASGWMPPGPLGAVESTVDAWDIISGEGDGLYRLRRPFVTWSYNNLSLSVDITSGEFALGDGKWIVAKTSGPITSFLAEPALEIAAVDQWDWYPSAHKFDDDEPYSWEESYLPIWQLVAAGDETPEMIEVGINNGTRIFGRRYISGITRLALNLASTTGRLRTVPEFF